VKKIQAAIEQTKEDIFDIWPSPAAGIHSWSYEHRRDDNDLTRVNAKMECLQEQMGT
jgi:hypothetical protein